MTGSQDAIDMTDNDEATGRVVGWKSGRYRGSSLTVPLLIGSGNDDEKKVASLTFTMGESMIEQNVVKTGQGRELGGYPMVSGQIRTLTPIKAMRAKCLDCVCGSRSEVRLCDTTGCSLWPYRMGKRPKPSLIVEDGTEQRESQYPL